MFQPGGRNTGSVISNPENKIAFGKLSGNFKQAWGVLLRAVVNAMDNGVFH